MLARLCAFLVTLMLMAPAAADASAPLTIGALQEMVSGLGFETSTDHKTYVAIRDQVVPGATVHFALGAAGSSLRIYSSLSAIPKEKAQGIPAIAMLKFNDAHDFAFALGTADHEDHLVLARTIDATDVTPSMLRRSIDALKTAVGESRTLRNQAGWPDDGKVTPKTYAALLADADTVWETSPLALRNLMFVTEKPSVFGAYKRRDGNVFKIGEHILTYAEPFGYAWKPSDDGLFRFGVSMDYTLLAGDTVLSGEEKVLTYSNASKSKIREFMLNMSLDFNGLLPGKYTLRYTAHDMFSKKTATASMPFEIVE